MSFIGQQLKDNMMNGRPTRTKSYSDYVGMAIPPCGDFEESGASRRRNMPPWLSLNNSVLYAKPLSLHDEIKLFMEYITPSPQEVVIRSDIVKRFTTLVESLDPNVTAIPVGSYVTGLNLPTSDIDMVLKSRVRQTLRDVYSPGYRLRELYYELICSSFSSKIEDILHASVPLIRITEKKTGIEIDLTESDTHSVKATQAVEKWLRHESEITRMLIFVVKIFLSVRRCGTTYTGGINSYVVVWMVVAWVHLEWPKLKAGPSISKPSTADDLLSSLIGGLDNLSLSSSNVHRSQTTTTRQNQPRPDFGDALKGFLKFYGLQFDYERVAIAIEPTPRYVQKTSSKLFDQRFLLSIFDPADPSIDMGAKAYGIKHVKETFKEAYRALTERRSEIGPEGLLGAIIGGDFTKYVQKRNSLKIGKYIDSIV